MNIDVEIWLVLLYQKRLELVKFLLTDDASQLSLSIRKHFKFANVS